ncbi:MAG: SagB/ThcOx family dehydrogenase [Desulfobacterales bacterium]|jgi:SagB-type dehydrogenase family enzyme
MTQSTHPGQIVLDYHERTKHHRHRFARAAGYMDWNNQPTPFRSYQATPKLPLPLAAIDPPLDYAALYEPAKAAPTPFSAVSTATFLELSLGLSAWKALPGQRWSLRINPSSGNLHPTEAHLITTGNTGLPDGIYHYDPLAHALEQRALLPPDRTRPLASSLPPPNLLLALSSIHWREAWKYGERAFRYCQHDIGHALAALSLAARLLGWRLVRLETADGDIATALGFDRTPWPAQEREDPALIAAILPTSARPIPRIFSKETAAALGAAAFIGRPSQLSPQHRAWDIIPQVAAACRQPRALAPVSLVEETPSAPRAVPARGKAAAIIRQRRSAQAFDPEGIIARETFLGILDRTRPRDQCAPFDAAIGPVRISLVLFVHRVRDIPSGCYAFVRHPDHLENLRAATSETFAWNPIFPDGSLYLLAAGDYRAAATDLACRQEIAGESAFSLGMLARFEPEIQDRPWVYRHLFWEAGMIGQVLYLEAEARGLRGTGVGCYFDDPVHEAIGLRSRAWQSIYHFTVGFPVDDSRIQTLPPYYHLDPERRRGP